MTQQSNEAPFTMPPLDPAAMQAMWQQMMGQFARAGQPQAPAPDMPAEALKQMQKAWLDAMARWADEYMRSPQFLEQMKKSLEGALAMRRQVEEFIRKASEQSYGGALGMYDAVGAVRDAESWITRRIDELSARLGAIEDKLGVEKPARGARAKAAPKKSPRKPAGPAKKTSPPRSAASKPAKPAKRGKKKGR